MNRKNKKSPRIKAKEKAWNIFSQYIRLRDAIKTTGTKTHCKCCTCNKIYPAFGIGCLQAGHYIPGRRESNLFDEIGCHGQCYNCNHTLKGNWVPYQKFIIEKYGQIENDRLIRQNNIILQRTEQDYLDLIELYKSKYKKLDSQHD